MAYPYEESFLGKVYTLSGWAVSVKRVCGHGVSRTLFDRLRGRWEQYRPAGVADVRAAVVELARESVGVAPTTIWRLLRATSLGG